MKMHISIRLILTALLSLSGAAFAQSNFIWVTDVTGNAADEGLPVIIEMVNEDSVAGFQFTLHYNDASLSIDSVIARDRIAGLDLVTSRPAPGQVMVVVVGMGGGAISPGVGPALQLSLSIMPGAPDGVEPLSMSEVVFSNLGATTVPVAGLDGYVIVGEINVLRMRNGYLSNRLDLYNQLSIGGLQFTLGYDASIFDFDTVLATIRSENMVLEYNEAQPGSLITLLYKSDPGDSILAGTGSVLEFFFDNVQDPLSTVNQLHLSDVTLARPGGEVVTVQAIDGNHLFITRLIQVQSLDIGGDEDIQHLVNHTPAISYDYFDSMVQAQTRYHVQVSTQPNFSTIMWDREIVADGSTSITYAGESLLDGQTYYLRVKAGNDGFWSAWSVLQFRMNSLASEPAAISPVDNLVVIPPVDLLVSNSNDPEGDILVYFFDLYEDAALTIKLDSARNIIEGQEETSWQITVPLPDDRQYWWTAVAFDGYELGPVSGASSFLVNKRNNAPGSFTLIDPAENAEGLDPDVNFKWQRAIDPDPLDIVKYTLYYGPDLSDNFTETTVEGLVDTTFTATLSNDTEYYWLVEALDLDNLVTASNGGTPQRFVVGTVGGIVSVDGLAVIPGEFALHQNYPNPFNPSTTLRFDLPEATIVIIMVYDMLGREVARLVNRQMGAGYHQAVWNGQTSDGREAPAGIYIARFVAGDFVASHKMLLLK